MPSHYLNQCWNIVHWTLRNKIQCIFFHSWKCLWKYWLGNGGHFLRGGGGGGGGGSLKVWCHFSLENFLKKSKIFSGIYIKFGPVGSKWINISIHRNVYCGFFLSFIKTDVMQVIEICKEPVCQQLWYWPSFEIFWFQDQKDYCSGVLL